ncbi:MAG: RDD family protein [Novosphingobium sp.]|jgi:uncharacterized RDD family membrane protein YckC|nr:RDD family protein [Novosphingobium sp.]
MAQYGGFWRRFLAYLIDSIILNVAFGFVNFAIGIFLGMAMGGGPEIALVVSLLGGLIGLVGGWLYYAILESSSRQATFGKQALGLVVTDEAGRRISFGRATGRHFAKLVSALILMIGYFMAGWTRRKQGLHDMMAGTLVYKAGNPQDVLIDVEAFR